MTAARRRSARSYNGRMEQRVRETTDHAVLAALYLRSALGVRDPRELPPLRGVTPAERDADVEVARQWTEYWRMTVEPEAHPSDVPLELVPGFDTLVALPVTSQALLAAAAPHADAALDFVRRAHDRIRIGQRLRVDDPLAPYEGAIADEERRLGRPAHPFALRVQVLPLTQRGIWWIGELTIAVTDGLRDDVAAFGKAIRPIIADLV